MIEMPTGVVVKCEQHDLRDSLHTVHVDWDEVQEKPDWPSVIRLSPGDRVFLDPSRFVLRFRPKEGDTVNARVLGGTQQGKVKYLHTSNMKIDKVTVSLRDGPDITLPLRCIRPLK